MWLKGVTISTTDESNGNKSLTLLPLPATKKKRLQGLFFPPPDGISLDPCSAEPWARSTGLGWCCLGNCSGFPSLVVQTRGCHGLQEWKPAPANLPSPLPPEPLHPETPQPIPLSPVVMDLLHPSPPCRSRDPPGARNCGEKLGFSLKKTQTKAKSASLQGARSTKVLHTPQHSTTSFHSTLTLLSPGFHVKANFKTALESLSMCILLGSLRAS